MLTRGGPGWLALAVTVAGAAIGRTALHRLCDGDPDARPTRATGTTVHRIVTAPQAVHVPARVLFRDPAEERGRRGQ